MFAIIMAGGSGTRFWPASRQRLPKQFLKITGDRTMLEETLDRARALVDEDRIYVVVNREHEETTRLLLADARAVVLTEPFGRNTAACIGLAALHASRRADEPLIVLPADHFVRDGRRFVELLRAASEIARSGALVTLGIPPTRPETGFGYIRFSDRAGETADNAYFKVEEFVEKPDYETAVRYVAGGRHLWNSGVFVFTPTTILVEIQAAMPALHSALATIDSAIGTADYASVLESAYEPLEKISVDYGVMEHPRAPVYVFPGDFGWSDVGSWQALFELRSGECDQSGNLIVGSGALVDASNNLVYSLTDRLTALLGVEDLMVIDTPDALLIGRRDRSQEVKQFPELLKKSGRDDLC